WTVDSSLLPDLAAGLPRSDHGRAGFAGERLLELGQVRHRADDPVPGDRVRVALDHRAHSLRPDGVAAELTPRDEELLVRREAVRVRQRRLAPAGDLKGAVRDLGSSEVADRLPQDELPVVVQPRLDEVVFELVDDARALLLELLQVLGGPPVVQPP